MGLVQAGTSLGTFLQTSGARKMVPSRMLRIVPLGDFHIFFSLNSFTRASSGVMVAHLTPTLCFWMALAVDRDLVLGGVAVLHREVVGLERQVEEGIQELDLDPFPDDAGHFVAEHLDDRASDFSLHMGGEDNMGLGDFPEVEGSGDWLLRY